MTNDDAVIAWAEGKPVTLPLPAMIDAWMAIVGHITSQSPSAPATLTPEQERLLGLIRETMCAAGRPKPTPSVVV